MHDFNCLGKLLEAVLNSVLQGIAQIPIFRMAHHSSKPDISVSKLKEEILTIMIMFLKCI